MSDEDRAASSVTPQPVRVAVVGDVHIGAPLRQLDLAGSAARLREVAYAAAERLIATVSAARPDAVLLTGDLFDRGDGSDTALALAQRMVDEWSVGDRPVVAIGGNHDAESDLPGRLRLPRSAHWFAAEQPSTLELPALGLAVHGVSVRERDDVRRVFEAYPEPVAGAFNIAMLHSSLDLTFSKRVCLPVGLDELRGDDRYDAWALGHVHRRLVLHEKPLIAYPGGAHAVSENGSGARGFAMFEIGADHSARLTEVDVDVALELGA